MGIHLKNPVVVGACSLSKRISTVKEIEEAGAGALVIKSLFEEQIQLERAELDEEVSKYDDLYAESTTVFPRFEHGPKEHLYWIKQARDAVSIPLIASLNAVTPEVWVEYAKKLADTGVDGLELNFYSMPMDPQQSAGDIEMQEMETFSRVREAVKLPIAVKIHPYYTNLTHVVSNFDRLGADAVVLFNKLLQPDIDTGQEKELSPLMLSESVDGLLTLRWTALLSGLLEADLISSTGISTGNDAVKMLLAGAKAVQVVSSIYRYKVPYIKKILGEIGSWMESKGYETLDHFRGKVSKEAVKDPWAFERGQYIKALLGYD
jgi:dihydroorotate dehydrogenase (fumarate)